MALAGRGLVQAQRPPAPRYPWPLALPAIPRLTTFLPTNLGQPWRTMGISALRPKQLCFWMMHRLNSSSWRLSYEVMQR